VVNPARISWLLAALAIIYAAIILIILVNSSGLRAGGTGAAGTKHRGFCAHGPLLRLSPSRDECEAQSRLAITDRHISLCGYTLNGKFGEAAERRLWATRWQRLYGAGDLITKMSGHNSAWLLPAL
jgi:hypothetical protein